MSKRQRDAIDPALRAEPFGMNQSTDVAALAARDQGWGRF